MLDHPSLAIQVRPGLIAVNDDYRHRVVLISIRTHRIVWQYGHTDVRGTGRGYLSTPDGMDLLPGAQALAQPAVRALLQRGATRPAGGAAVVPAALRVRLAPFRLPSPVERAVAVGWDRRILVAGGLDSAGQSASGVFALDPVRGRLRSLGALPLPVHDGAGALIGGRLIVFGGGSSTSSDAVQAFDPGTRRGAIVARLPRPLSDLAAATVGGSTYLVGGFDGRSPRAEILATVDGRRFSVAGRLPVGLRYPAVAAAGGRILIAGGETANGLSSAVYSLDPSSRHVSLLARLPAPVAHAAAIVTGRTLYVVGGTNASGVAQGSVRSIDLTTRSVRTQPLVVRPMADAAVARSGATTLLIGGRRTVALATVVEVEAGRAS
jgi:hypothetical protein